MYLCSCSLTLRQCFSTNFRKKTSCQCPAPFLLQIPHIFLELPLVIFLQYRMLPCWERKGVTRSLQSVSELDLSVFLARACQTSGNWVHSAVGLTETEYCDLSVSERARPFEDIRSKVLHGITHIKKLLSAPSK